MTRVHWLLLMVATVPALFSLGDQIQDYDPAQYAEVARRMLATGEWLDLYDAFGPFTNKPPLTMWAQAAFMALIGVTSVAARLPTLLFGLVTLAATYGVGKALWNARVGALATVLLGASVGFHAMIADPKVDMPVLAFSTLAVLGFLSARTRPRWVWAGWLAGGLAMLAKGPVGLLLPLAAVGPETLFAAWAPGVPWWRRLGALKPVRGLALVAAMTVPFYVVMARVNGTDTALYLLVGQSFGRLTGASGYRDTTTPLFFFHTALWAFAPFVVWLVIALVQRAREVVRARALVSSPQRVVVWWLVIPFVAISFSLYKLPQYLYWLAPPSALLAAEALSRVEDAAAVRWARAGQALGVVAVGGIAVVLGFIFPGSWGWLVVGAGLLAMATRVTRHLAGAERAIAMWVAVAGVSLGFFHAHVHGALLAYQPWEQVAGLVRAEEPTGRAILVTGMTAPHSLAFYAQRELQHVDVGGLAAQLPPHERRLVVVGPEVSDAQLREAGLAVDQERRFDHYLTSVLQPSFFLAANRPAVLTVVRLLRVGRGEAE